VKTRKALDRQRPRVLQQTCEAGVGCRALLNWECGEIVGGRTLEPNDERKNDQVFHRKQYQQIYWRSWQLCWEIQQHLSKRAKRQML